MGDFFKALAAYEAQKDPKLRTAPQELSAEQKEIHRRFIESLDNPALKNNASVANAGAMDMMKRLSGGGWSSPETYNGAVGYAGSSPFSSGLDAIFSDLASRPPTPTVPKPSTPGAGGGGGGGGFGGGGGRVPTMAPPPDHMQPEIPTDPNAMPGAFTDWNPDRIFDDWDPFNNMPPVDDPNRIPINFEPLMDWIRQNEGKLKGAGAGALRGALTGAGWPGALVGAFLGWLRGNNETPQPGGSGAIDGSITGSAGGWGD